MKKILIIGLIALAVGFYAWPKETENGVNKTVHIAVSTGTGAIKGATAGVKQALNN